LDQSSSGKTSLVRFAVEVTGNVYHEFSMNNSVDTTELLGGGLNKLIFLDTLSVLFVDFIDK